MRASAIIGVEAIQTRAGMARRMGAGRLDVGALVTHRFVSTISSRPTTSLPNQRDGVLKVAITA